MKSHNGQKTLILIDHRTTLLANDSKSLRPEVIQALKNYTQRHASDVCLFGGPSSFVELVNRIINPSYLTTPDIIARLTGHLLIQNVITYADMQLRPDRPGDGYRNFFLPQYQRIKAEQLTEKNFRADKKYQEAEINFTYRRTKKQLFDLIIPLIAENYHKIIVVDNNFEFLQSIQNRFVHTLLVTPRSDEASLTRELLQRVFTFSLTETRHMPDSLFREFRNDEIKRIYSAGPNSLPTVVKMVPDDQSPDFEMIANTSESSLSLKSFAPGAKSLWGGKATPINFKLCKILGEQTTAKATNILSEFFNRDLLRIINSYVGSHFSPPLRALHDLIFHNIITHIENKYPVASRLVEQPINQINLHNVMVLLDVDDTLLQGGVFNYDRDIEKPIEGTREKYVNMIKQEFIQQRCLNENLLTALKNNGLIRIALFTDMSSSRNTIWERKALIQTLRERGFIISDFDVLTPMDGPWNLTTPQLEKFENELKNFKESFQSPQFQELLNKHPEVKNAISNPARAGSGYQALQEAKLKDLQQLEQHGRTCKGLSGFIFSQMRRLANPKALMFEQFVRDYADTITSCMIFDDNDRVLSSINQVRGDYPVSLVKVTRGSNGFNQSVEYYHHLINQHLLGMLVNEQQPSASLAMARKK